jgi:hypothetical protein
LLPSDKKNPMDIFEASALFDHMLHVTLTQKVIAINELKNDLKGSEHENVTKGLKLSL